MLAIMFPPLDPVLIEIGPLAIRWYALAYMAGFILGWRYALRLARGYPAGPNPQLFDDFLVWGVIGTVLGGRLGYVLFYQFEHYLQQPLEILQVWHGGMAFHGGMLGVIFAMWLYARRHKMSFFAFSDVWACVTPIGLFFGRIANFINGELYGRASDAPWAVIFPRGGDIPRHPSQLYEALLEGVVLFVLLNLLARNSNIRAKAGFISGMFLVGYGVFRFIVEFFREPDAHLGFLYAGATMGQLLCLPMIAAGLIIIAYALRRRAA